LSALSEKVNASHEVAQLPLRAATAEVMSSVTQPVLCLGAALAVAAVGVAAGAVYGEVVD
jgi:hypothetical protein